MCATLELGEPTDDLVELTGNPIAPAQVFGPCSGLVSRQYRRIHEAVGESLLEQHGPTRRPPGGREMTVAQDVQILANHATVVQNGAVIGDESRDFSERIERNERAV